MALRSGVTAINSQIVRQICAQNARSVSLSCVHGVDAVKKRQVEPKGIETLEDKSRQGLTITVDAPMDLTPISGVPEEHTRPRKVLIKMPTKNAMQSGSNGLKKWVMTFDTKERWENPLMGWSSTADPLSNMEMQFTNKEDAIVLCEKNGWQWSVQDPPQKPPRAKSYAANFSWDKRTRRSCK